MTESNSVIETSAPSSVNSRADHYRVVWLFCTGDSKDMYHPTIGTATRQYAQMLAGMVEPPVEHTHVVQVTLQGLEKDDQTLSFKPITTGHVGCPHDLTTE